MYRHALCVNRLPSSTELHTIHGPSEERQCTDFEGRGNLGYLIIGASKLASALLLGAAGFGIFRLLNRDLGEALQHLASRLHLDPENRSASTRWCTERPVSTGPT